MKRNRRAAPRTTTSTASRGGFQRGAFQSTGYQEGDVTTLLPQVTTPQAKLTTPDIRIVQNTFFPKYSVTCDWSLLPDGTLDDTEALATAVIVALGTDALAQPDDILPDPNSTNRRGWWGDMDAQTIWGGWPIGSRLWLLSRAKITEGEAFEGATTSRVEQYIREAIGPFLRNRIGTSMFVEATRVGLEQINALVRIYRGPRLEIELRYQVLWAEITPSGGAFDIGDTSPIPNLTLQSRKLLPPPNR